ncbi:hypothetical protein BHE74_00010570 [Ensete ventricosum]|nr:hypothetical protein GW17_00002019 [Ensete ventricosum]RWW81063.1 hypothetical protein BHE74_00010570 [Ensete ventricosum]RZR84020.1 hypothetical protein BHM03_00010758 [Ensete ventricosum]
MMYDIIYKPFIKQASKLDEQDCIGLGGTRTRHIMLNLNFWRPIKKIVQIMIQQWLNIPSADILVCNKSFCL